MINTILKIISAIGLILTLGPSVLVFLGLISLETHKILMLIGTVLWFVATPFWMYRKSTKASE